MLDSGAGEIRLFGFGESYFLPGADIHPCSGYLVFEYAAQGFARFTSPDGSVHSFKAGSGALIQVRDSYRITIPMDGRDFRKIFLLIRSGPLTARLCNRGGTSGVPIEFHDRQEIERLLQEIRETTHKGGGRLHLKLSVLVYNLLLEIIRQGRPDAIVGGLEEKMQGVMLRIADPWNLESLAKHFGVGSRTLNRMFQQKLNISPIACLARLRLEYAAQLLLHDTLSISDVAAECGFRNLPFFSREFKRLHKTSPSKYRRVNGVGERKR